MAEVPAVQLSLGERVRLELSEAGLSIKIVRHGLAGDFAIVGPAAIRAALESPSDAMIAIEFVAPPI